MDDRREKIQGGMQEVTNENLAQRPSDPIALGSHRNNAQNKGEKRKKPPFVDYTLGGKEGKEEAEGKPGEATGTSSFLVLEQKRGTGESKTAEQSGENI